jgi:hypothetical protein
LSIGESLYEHVKRLSEKAKLEKKKKDEKRANQVYCKKAMTDGITMKAMLISFLCMSVLKDSVKRES